MAKISELPSAGALTGTEQIPANQSGTTVKVLLSAIKTYISSSFASSGANSDITSLSGLTTPLSLPQGGTGQANANSAFNALVPSQSSNSGKYLTTNGTNTSWGSISADTVGFKNRIINGAMVIDQRNAGASITPTANAYSVDRWSTSLSSASKFSIQQNAGAVTPPIGFINYVGVTSLSSYSVPSGDNFALQQPIEGLNCSDLGWGTANAQTVTLSFWVRSSLTGTFGGVLTNSAFNRSYPYSYTISVANTWEYKTVTIAGDTSGTWLTTNGVGIRVWFNLGAGSTVSGTAGAWAGANYFAPTGATSVVGTNGATFYITGVQLEKGSTATSFDYRPYGTELALCQRYLPCLNSLSTNDPISLAYTPSTTIVRCDVPFKVTPRVPPTGISVSSASHLTWDTGGASGTPSAVSFASASLQTGRVTLSVTGATVGQSAAVVFNSASGQIQFTGCEL
jgi:hypothetical protein